MKTVPMLVAATIAAPPLAAQTGPARSGGAVERRGFAASVFGKGRPRMEDGFLPGLFSHTRGNLR